MARKEEGSGMGAGRTEWSEGTITRRAAGKDLTWPWRHLLYAGLWGEGGGFLGGRDRAGQHLDT